MTCCSTNPDQLRLYLIHDTLDHGRLRQARQRFSRKFQQSKETFQRSDREVELQMRNTNLVATDDDDFDRRQQRRRYEEPLHVKLRKQILSIAENVSRWAIPGKKGTLTDSVF